MSKKYYCIGGPLDGQFVARGTSTWDDNFQNWTNNESPPELVEYHDFNAAYGGNSEDRKVFPTMVRIHESLIKGKAKPPKS